MSARPELAALLEHPAIWRGSHAAQPAGIPTGFAALDEQLPGRGWPRTGLIEILPCRPGIGEISLLLPALAALTRHPAARWCVWVAPPELPARGAPSQADPEHSPLEPFAPALAAAGLALHRVLVVRPGGSPAAALWAFEQALGSGACDVALAWLRPRPLELRRLQLAAERGRALGILFRAHSAARAPSAAALRVSLALATGGLRLTILKSRGGARGCLELAWQTGAI
jgi:protein ImuA